MNKASTYRLNSELQTALDEISAHLGTTKNQIVNEALAEYLEKREAELRTPLDETRRKLRAYRNENPRFEADIECFAEAESTCAGDDTHEGRASGESNQSLSRDIHGIING